MADWPYSTAAWRRLRKRKLSVNPVCEPCEKRGRTVLADTVDHIIAIEKGGDAFPALSGLMSMCARCHNEKTNAVDHPSASGFRRALKGFDADGNPIDPEGWSAPSGPPCGADGHRAFAGLEPTGHGPAGETRKDLVSYLLNNETKSIKEIEQWD